MEFVSQHISEIVSAIVGAIAGAGLTFSVTKNSNKASHGSTAVDQRGARAGHSNVGGNQYNNSNPPPRFC